MKHVGFSLSLFAAERQAEEQRIPIFIVIDLIRPGIKSESIFSVADAVCSRFLVGIVQHVNEQLNIVSYKTLFVAENRV